MARHRARPTVTSVFVPPSVAALLGSEADALHEALSAAAPVSLRLNPLKPVSVEGSVVPWCAEGRYLAERPVFTLDPRLHAGCYYVQEASSMLLEQAVRASGILEHDLAVLDLCAAPGGKSTHLASLITPGSLLISNEPVAQRRAILAENIWKHGRPAVAIGRAMPARFAVHGERFDLVVVDAPCSGEGMFRKDPFARTQWNEALVESCAREQTTILEHAWSSLRPGGVLIYSTCTWERRENEERLEQLLQAGGMPLPIPMDPAWGVVASDIGYRCYPHRLQGEGFFLGMVRKPGAFTPQRPQAAPPAEAVPHVLGPASYRTLTQGDVPHAVQAPWYHLVQLLTGSGLLEHPGTPLLYPKGPTMLPHAALALNRLLDPAAFEEVRLSGTEALQFLRGESLPLRGLSGMVLVYTEGQPTGWAKGTGDRLNVHWPAAWRIRLR